MEKLLDTRIDAAIELRKSLGLPSAHTNTFRLVNSEGDRYSTSNYAMVISLLTIKRFLFIYVWYEGSSHCYLFRLNLLAH